MKAHLTARVVELRERLGETLMQSLQSSAPVGLACLDRDFRFVRVNDALAEMNRLLVDGHRPIYVV
jgi:PAS domain-containing protein